MPNESKTICDPTQCFIEEHWRDGTVVISCTGEIDMVSAPLVQRHIAAACNANPRSVIVDLTGVSFLASQGIGVVVTAHQQCMPAIPFAVVATTRATRRPMELLGITAVLSVHHTIDDAIRAVTR